MRRYEGDRTGNGDYESVHEFLVLCGNEEYTYGRFDWMMTNWDYLESRYLSRIGLWEENGKLVGAALFDHSLDVVFPIVMPGYARLYPEMLKYAEENMVREENPEFLVCAADGDEALLACLQRAGYTPTKEREAVAMFDLSEHIPETALPEGYRIASLEEGQYEAYFRCLFRGFGHEEAGETFSWDDAREREVQEAYGRHFVNKAIKVSVADETGAYAAHCGMWYDPDSRFALIEPVCVVPEKRRQGLGRAAVYEGLRRVQALGAQYAVVGSDQPFYSALGMVPHGGGTVWKPQEKK